MEAKKIPIINYEEIEEEEYKKLREASEKWGCFRLLNHGVPTKLMAEMKEVAKDLLALPVEIKQRNEDVLPGTGHVAPSDSNPFFEGLGLVGVSSSHFVSSFCSQLDASPQQRKTIEMYTQVLNNLTIDLAGKLAKSMGLTCYSFSGWQYHLKMNKYTFTQENLGSTALQLHTDSGFLTILQDDESLGGLEVIDQDGNYVVVDPWPGTFLVNLGDTAYVWSNGRLHDVQHRVQCKDVVGLRHSIISLITPPPGKIMEVPPEFIDDKHPCLFANFDYEEYRNRRYAAKLHAGEALELFHTGR